MSACVRVYVFVSLEKLEHLFENIIMSRVQFSGWPLLLTQRCQL